ncbi:MAG TPA: MSEP-CTERM sorting domain-containing protein, partial [Kiritimatiellia bacterium]
MSTPEAARELIPPALKKPAALLLAWVVPQAILLLLNARGFWLVAGELEPEQHARFVALLSVQAALFLAGLGVALYHQRRRRDIGWITNLPILAVHVAYLWLATAWLDRMLPPSVTLWILPPERMMLYQYTFVMPALFYAMGRLACFPTALKPGADWGAAIAATVGVPVVFYFLVHVASRVIWKHYHQISDVLIFGAFVVGTLLALIGLLRLLALLCNTIRRRGEHGMMVVAALVGLVCPQLGLLLNATIPFPSDFQSLGVYVMAAVNGILLLLPRTGNRAVDAAIWLGRIALFPFTLYFFLVFLPYLPLSLLAMIAMGAGFLMLTPTALLAVHGIRLWHGYQDLRAPLGRRACALLAAAAFCVLPAFYTAQAWLHRAVLHDALNYVYASDPVAEPVFGSDVGALRHVLDHLRDQEDGIELPYLAQFYDWIVFDNLTLPPSKRERLRETFLGPDTEARNKSGGNFFFGSRRGNRGSPWRRPGAPPPALARLVDARSATEAEGDAEKTTLTFEIRNDTSQVDEFATTIQVPPGVLVSGYALYIGKERVPGQIFEKKTAMWVYRMIRDMTRRDPGLLVYRDRDTLELRVFPLAAGETRTTEIEFLYPAGLAPAVRVGDRVIQSGAASPRPSVLSLPDGG